MSLQISITEIHAAVPQHLFEKSTSRALYYVSRDILFSVAFYRVATYIDPLARMLASHEINKFAIFVLRWTLWFVYWWWESVTLAGWWCLGEVSHVVHLHTPNPNQIVFDIYRP